MITPKIRKKIKILEICFSRSLGGLELYSANISSYLKKRGHNVLAVVSPESELHNHLLNKKIETITIRPRQRYLDYTSAKKIARIIREKDFEIVHIHQSTDLSTAILAKKIAGQGKVVFTQQMESNRRKKDIFHNWVYRNLDGLISITERIRQQVSRNTKLPPNRLYQLYYGIDLNQFQPDGEQRERARSKFGISRDEQVIGLVGRLEKGKGQHILLEAAGRLIGSFPKIKIMLIGGETMGQSGHLNYLKNLAATKKIKDLVIFTGFREDVPAVTAALDVVVLCSRKETFGLSLIECMAQQTVPIGTNTGGVPEIIQDGMNGLLVPPFEVEALTSAIKSLLADPSLKNKLAENARKTVQEKFNLESHLEGLEEIFIKVLKNE